MSSTANQIRKIFINSSAKICAGRSRRLRQESFSCKRTRAAAAHPSGSAIEPGPGGSPARTILLSRACPAFRQPADPLRISPGRVPSSNTGLRNPEQQAAQIPSLEPGSPTGSKPIESSVFFSYSPQNTFDQLYQLCKQWYTEP